MNELLAVSDLNIGSFHGQFELQVAVRPLDGQVPPGLLEITPQAPVPVFGLMVSEKKLLHPGLYGHIDPGKHVAVPPVFFFNILFQ